ncbi:MAG: type II toxin-antitoxin system VapC family toxin [Saprospiraceae bacterium]
MKKLLVDTHALIWFLRGDSSLSQVAEKAMRAPENIKFVSIASLWEIAIKVNLKKIELDFSLADFENLLADNQFEVFPIGFQHVVRVAALSLHHRDPFDRMLIAQALTEGLAIVTRDPHFPDYGVPIVW